MKRKRCVQFQHVTTGPRDSADSLIEQLRYVGMLTVIKQSEIEINDDTNGVAYMLQIRCPHGLDDEIWARQNAEWMRSFGTNAEDVFES